MNKKKVTVNTLKRMKSDGEKIACLTAYDMTFARLLEQAGIDVILVGDSLGMVIQGEETTLKVRMSDMVYHSGIVKKACKNSLLITDMPFMSYSTCANALGNAARLVSEGGAEFVKMEGGAEIADIVSHVVTHGIPVCGHLGLTPQSIHKLGGYHLQGRQKNDAERLMKDAKILEQAGADILVLECIPQTLANEITVSISIPVIGIGAGAGCDGQVLVLYDLLGMTEKQPRFSRNFMIQSGSIVEAIENYVSDVKSSKFPAPDHCFD